jgi:hypothetical protein
MRKSRLVICAHFALLLPCSAGPLHSRQVSEGVVDQQSAPASHRTDDVSTLDGIIKAFYDVVSGPAGEAPERARDERLHMPGAVIGISEPGPEGRAVLRTMDLAEYYERYGGPRSQPFYEWEVHRETHQFGNIAQVFSTYESRIGPKESEPVLRGINSVQLVRANGRWWIAHLVWDIERPNNPIPLPYLHGDV